MAVSFLFLFFVLGGGNIKTANIIWKNTSPDKQISTIKWLLNPCRFSLLSVCTDVIQQKKQNKYLLSAFTFVYIWTSTKNSFLNTKVSWRCISQEYFKCQDILLLSTLNAVWLTWYNIWTIQIVPEDGVEMSQFESGSCWKLLCFYIK